MLAVAAVDNMVRLHLQERAVAAVEELVPNNVDPRALRLELLILAVAVAVLVILLAELEAQV